MITKIIKLIKWSQNVQRTYNLNQRDKKAG